MVSLNELSKVPLLSNMGFLLLDILFLFLFFGLYLVGFVINKVWDDGWGAVDGLYRVDIWDGICFKQCWE